jgi:hypothetical protein
MVNISKIVVGRAPTRQNDKFMSRADTFALLNNFSHSSRLEISLDFVCSCCGCRIPSEANGVEDHEQKEREETR